MGGPDCMILGRSKVVQILNKIASLVPVVIFEKLLLNFTFSDLLSATSNFDQDTLLAEKRSEGLFGSVYRGFLAGGVHVAIKVLVHGSTMIDHEAATELEHLGRIKLPNLVPLMGYCLAGEQQIEIYDYMENGDLHNLLYDLPLGVRVTKDWRTGDTWEKEEEADENGIQNIGSEVLSMTWRFRSSIEISKQAVFILITILNRDYPISGFRKSLETVSITKPKPLVGPTDTRH